MKKLLFIILLIPITFFSQLKTETNPWVQFSRDSVQNDRLEKSLNQFLNFVNQGNFKHQYLDIEHFTQNEDFFKEFKEISKSNYYKDSLFYKPVLKKSYTFNKKDYFITLSFVGIDSVSKKSITNKTLNLKANVKEDYYQFFSVFKDHLKLYQSKNIDGIQFYYQGKFDTNEAKRMVRFTKKLEKLTGKKSFLKNYYKCENVQDAIKLLGIEYDMSYSRSATGFGWSDDFGNFITGVNSEAYIHDYIHSFFSKNYDRKKIWREFEEGIAIYYGGNWEVSFQEIRTVLQNIVKENSKFDFLSELKKGRKSKRYDAIHLYDRLISAVLVEYIIKTKDFKTVLNILHCGAKGEQFFEKLNQHLGISEDNFNEKFIQML